MTPQGQHSGTFLAALDLMERQELGDAIGNSRETSSRLLKKSLSRGFEDRIVPAVERELDLKQTVLGEFG